jgi:hypothetical protein
MDVPFEPTKLLGCVLWLRADRGLTLDGSQKVQAWADMSGKSNSVSQATPGSRPGIAQTGPNGGQCLVFDGSASCLLGATAPFTGSFTLSLIAAGNATQSFCAYTCGDNGTGVSVGTGISLAGRIANYNGKATDQDQTSGATTSWEKWTLTHNASGPSQALRVNGAAHTLSPNTTAMNAPSQQCVGARNNSAPQLFWAGRIHEIVAYNRVLSTAEILALEAYQYARLGI